MEHKMHLLAKKMCVSKNAMRNVSLFMWLILFLKAIYVFRKLNFKK